jgi:hypothetical protein
MRRRPGALTEATASPACFWLIANSPYLILT